ncbi:MAG TPA: D-2-hydroxyacid dehydrogenase family protein [Chloroflexota bacterium]|nr:D-2-hydroxyacid dehydrogenase family protein [Chloroflexota bacterium]
MSAVKVGILDDWQDAWRHTDAAKRLAGRAQVEYFLEPVSELPRLSGFEVLVANRERMRFPAEVLKQLTSLKLLVQTGGRAPNIDVEAATAQGIVVGKAAGGSSTGASELTIALILDILRQVSVADAAMHRGEWPAPLGRELNGKTLGLIGVGSVGGRVARLAAPFGAKLLAYTRTNTAEKAAAAGAEPAALDDLLRRSDIVSIHVPLTPESRGLIGEAQLALMKPTAYLINTSRGPIVEERALIRALAEHRIAGAALDVFDEEPLPADHSIRKLTNVLLTPHVGWPTDLGFERFAGPAVDVILAYLDGKTDFPRFN